MHHKTLLIIVAATVGSSLAACDPEGEAVAMPANMTAVGPTTPAPSLERTEFQSGTTGDFGPDCRAGFITVNKEFLQVSVSTGGGRGTSLGSRQMLKWGEVLVACGGLYRSVSHKTGGFAVFEATPVALPAGVSLRRGSLVVTVGGEGTLFAPEAKETDFGAKLTSIAATGGKPVAVVDLEVSTATGKARRPAVELEPGDSVATALGKYTVLAVVPPDAGKGIPGWIEIDPRPTP